MNKVQGGAILQPISLTVGKDSEMNVLDELCRLFGHFVYCSHDKILNGDFSLCGLRLYYACIIWGTVGIH